MKNDCDEKQHKPDKCRVPAKYRANQAVTGSSEQQIAKPAPEIQMRADDCERAVMMRNVRNQNRRGKKRERLEKICGRLVHTIGQSA